MDSETKIVSLVIPNYAMLINLEEYNYFLKTILAQNLKSFSTIGGYTNVACVNSLKQLQFSDEICKLINSIIIKLPGFSAYCGILISRLLLKLWSEPTFDDGQIETCKTLEMFQKILKSSIESLKIEQKTINVSFLQTLVIPLLMEEPAICLGKEGVHDLSLCIVKAVLSGTDYDLRWGSLHVFVTDGEQHFFTVKGIICEVDDVFVKHMDSGLFQHQSDSSKIVLFTESLEFCEKLAIITEELVKNDIALVVCQKKIADKAKIVLRRAKIMVIESIGEDIMKALEHLTGATPVRDIEKCATASLILMIGHFSEIKSITKGRKNLVSIVNCKHSVVTLFIQCRTIADSSLIKEVVNNSLRLVWSALSSPFYLPGPVSFEESLRSSLKANLTMTSFALDTIIISFINALEEISNLYIEPALTKIDYVDIYDSKRNAILCSFETVMNILCLCRIIRRV